jgi:hypothetical protein
MNKGNEQRAVAIKKELIRPSFLKDTKYIRKEQPINPINCGIRKEKSLRLKMLVESHNGKTWKGGWGLNPPPELITR